MVCHNCEKQISNGEKICPYCGVEQAVEDHGASPVAQQQSSAQLQPVQEFKKENIFGGIIGALFGALVGIIGVVFLEMLTGFWYISGAIIAVYVFLNWRIFGRRLSNVGFVICTVITIAAVYLCTTLIYGIAVSNINAQWEYIFVFEELDSSDIIACIRTAKEAMSTDSALMASYYHYLLVLYISAALGAAAVILYFIRNRRYEGTAKRRSGVIFLSMVLLTVCILGGSFALADKDNPEGVNLSQACTAVRKYADRKLKKMLQENEDRLQRIEKTLEEIDESFQRLQEADEAIDALQQLIE